MTPRVLLWIARTLIVAIAGFVRRKIRRLLGKPPRIWHGMTPVHSTAWMVQAERKAGFPSMSVVMNTRASRRYALVRAEDFDRVFEEGGVRWDDVHWLALNHLLWHGDIWNAYFDCLFFHHDDRRKNELAFRLIRAMGIKILVQLHGSDILALGLYQSRYGWPERAQLDYPNWDLEAQRAVVETRIDLFTRYSHFVLCGDVLYEPVLPRCDASFHTVPVDTDVLKPEEPRNRGTEEPPVIIHAPNHRHLKGTHELLATLERLRARGFAFELKLIEGVPRHEALQLYGRADIVADQFVIGAFGIFALEGLALGKPVLTYLDEEHLQRSIYNHPLVNTNLDNMSEVLAALIEVPELRRRIGAAGRQSIVRYQSVDVLAEVWTHIYQHMWLGAPLALETLRPFEAARGTRALTEDPCEASFWPVPVDDLLPQIHAAIARLRD